MLVFLGAALFLGLPGAVNNHPARITHLLMVDSSLVLRVSCWGDALPFFALYISIDRRKFRGTHPKIFRPPRGMVLFQC